MDNNTPNTGSFMAPTNQPGVGPELQQLMQNGGPALDQNSQNPQATMPSSPPPAGNPMPNGISNSPRPQQPTAGQTYQGGDPMLQIALNALSQYIKSHGAVLEANHGVPLQQAHAKVVAAHAPQQGGE